MAGRGLGLETRFSFAGTAIRSMALWLLTRLFNHILDVIDIFNYIKYKKSIYSNESFFFSMKEPSAILSPLRDQLAHPQNLGQLCDFGVHFVAHLLDYLAKLLIFRSQLLIFHSQLLIFHSQLFIFHSQLLIFHSQLFEFLFKMGDFNCHRCLNPKHFPSVLSQLIDLFLILFALILE